MARSATGVFNHRNTEGLIRNGACLLLFLDVFLFAPAPGARAADVPFGSARVIWSGSRVTGIAAADVDRDGGLDVATAEASFLISWHENAAGNGSTWVRHVAVNAGDELNGILPVDIDLDQDVDLLFGYNGLVRGAGWAENISGNGSSWGLRSVGDSYLDDVGPSFATAADVDGDGDMDVIARNTDGGEIVWWEHPNAGSSWTKHLVATGLGFANSVLGVDVDRDGDTDIVNGGTLSWYENTAGNGTAWTLHSIGSGGHPVWIDVDGDGDRDIATTGSGVRWYENTAGDGSVWTLHTASGVLSNDVFGIDLDRDGDTDLLAASEGSHQVLWYENTTGNGLSWTAHVISTALNSPRYISAADLDGDGDEDVFVESWLDQNLVWFENESQAIPTLSPLGAVLGVLILLVVGAWRLQGRRRSVGGTSTC